MRQIAKIALQVADLGVVVLSRGVVRIAQASDKRVTRSGVVGMHKWERRDRKRDSKRKFGLYKNNVKSIDIIDRASRKRGKGTKNVN